MITLILWAVSFVTHVPFWAYLFTGIVDGLLFIPVSTYAMVPYLGSTVREKVGRLYAMQAAVIAGAHAFVQRADGYQPGIVDEDEGAIHLARETIPLDVDRTTWYRLANRKLALPWARDGRLLREYADIADVPLKAVGDGYGLLDRRRGGHWALTPYPEQANPDAYTQLAEDDANASAGDALAVGDGGRVADGHLVYSPHVAMPLKGSADTDQSEAAEEKGMRDHAGDRQMSQKMQIIAGLAAILMGSISGLVMVILL